MCPSLNELQEKGQFSVQSDLNCFLVNFLIKATIDLWFLTSFGSTMITLSQKSSQFNGHQMDIIIRQGRLH